MYYVYILKSVMNNRLYIGSTNDVNRRILEHNNGNVSSTKAYIPYKLIKIEKFLNKKGALKREFQIKKSGILRQQLKQLN
ncbi:GIY-YIG nuclease family protein [Patescibacteria group bacterium]|nr:GIY-YIG nuclease family protein [Patescibacteria group bacterium]